MSHTRPRRISPDLGFTVERVTGIEPALSAWESVLSGRVTWPDLRFDVSVSDHEGLLVTGVNGTLMARRTPPALMAAIPWAGEPNQGLRSDRGPYSGYALRTCVIAVDAGSETA
jgi:hypothetical protein